MSDIKELIKFLDRIEKHTELRYLEEPDSLMLTEIKGILELYAEHMITKDSYEKCPILKQQCPYADIPESLLAQAEPAPPPDEKNSGLADALQVFLDSEDSLTIHQCADHILMAIHALRQPRHPQPDEELIQNTYDEIYTHITYDIDMRISIDEDEIKSIIRKLLEGER